MFTNSTTMHISQINLHTCSAGNLNKNVCSSTIANSKKLEIAKCALIINMYVAIYSFNGLLEFSIMGKIQLPSKHEQVQE